MTPQEALDAIAQLCCDSWSEGGYEGGDAVISADDVRAILGRVEPGPAVPAQGTVIHEEPGQYRIDRWVDDDGPAVPAHDIDRDALLDVLLDYDQNEYSTRQTADRILELVKHDA